MITCFECGKSIKGKAVLIQPSILACRLGDFARSYHPGCYRKANKQAEIDLYGMAENAPDEVMSKN